ncbi:LacI family DNA-binding transcriptional regulator [Martelella mediterranea]|uniref:LacI family DNA-binding transcriptional regulator n=1 Tax=Martelella mediterranea TaxID=293089 RepID=UPI002E7B4044|nr:LacI family DNA-binding transcriptional regulator [Martelella mediterranea]MCD1636379.1 LacI family DNA-binding transcriptional regulator [Martelella mediterranea]
MSRKTTLEEIAKAAGLSIATVDRVVNRRGGVSPKSEAKVLDWARRLDLDRKIFRAHAATLRIAVLLPSPDNPFFAAMRDAFSALEGHGDGFRIRCFIHDIDPIDSARIVKRIHDLSEQYDGIVICCPDHPDVSCCLAAVSKRIPIVTLVSDLPASGRLAYVGPDNRRIGRAAGELMGRFIGRDGGKVLVLLGYHRIIGHQEREMGFRAVLRERFPGLSLLDIAESEENSARAASLVRRALETSEDVRGIYNVSAGNYRIAKTLEELGKTGDVVFITHELTPLRCELLRKGILDAVIDQNPRLEASKSLEILAAHFKRAEQPNVPEAFTAFEIFLRENCPNL